MLHRCQASLTDWEHFISRLPPIMLAHIDLDGVATWAEQADFRYFVSLGSNPTWLA